MEFESYKCSLLYEFNSKKPEALKMERGRKKSTLPDHANKNLSLISSLYLYTNTPPHGYGTQAPKVAETVCRSYGFNLKEKDRKIQIFGRDIERMQWERQDGKFPFNAIHGNFIPSEARKMVESFLKENQPYIDSCADKTIKKMLEQNSDVLTKGKQTFCPFTGQSVTSAVAYKRMYEFLSKNTGSQCFSCLEWIQAYFSLFEKDSIEYTTSTWVTEDKKTYSKSTKQKLTRKIKVRKMVTIKTSSKEETREAMTTISTRFASYLKHKERGKKDRRAIASANTILRMFLHIIEDFHLELSKKVEGATISIGGEEKKQKISSNMSIASLPHGPANTLCQGTEDATKWNECLSPALFALMHKYFFDSTTRIRLGLPAPTPLGKLFSMLAVSGNFLMAMKEIQIGHGVMATNETQYARIEWSEKWEQAMNERTRAWFTQVKHLLTGGGEFLRASPGMLMGMMNAGSTTLGMIAANHRMNKDRMKVLTLRSSDDSMSLYMGLSADDNKRCIEMNRRNLGMLGINLSPDKTFFFREGLGEYTSWYMDKKFVSQFGTETAALRPKGVNPHDDFNSMAKETSTALMTLTINHMGATARLRLGADGTRRLWRIKKEIGKRPGISQRVQLLADGGSLPWNCANCHLEETSLRWYFSRTAEEQQYLQRIRNPENPFAPETCEEMTYSKEHGTLILDTVDHPRTCFNYLRKSNRTLDRKDKQEQAESEQAHHDATKIINMVDPTTLINYPTTNSVISSHLSSILKIEMSKTQLDENQTKIVADAIKLLDTGDTTLMYDDEDQDMGEHDDPDEWEDFSI